MAEAGPSRGPDSWVPTKHLEPLHPDNEEVLEQAAYQAAVTKHGGDSRQRRYKPRRTVDYMGGIQKWRMITKLKSIPDHCNAIHPNPSDLINLLPAAALRLNPSTSICDQFVHTSINKERSPTRVVKWTPDSRRLLTGNDKGQFTLWNGNSFNYESITQVHDDSIRCFEYSHSGQALISADKTGVVKYFTPHLTNIHGFQAHREACHGVGFSPNDERFVTGGDDGLVKIWSYREAREERILSGHGWDVRCVDWHPTKGLVVSGSKDMLVKFWDPRTGKDLSTLHSHKSTVNSTKWGPDGHLVATAGGDGMVRLFDIRTFRELEAMKGHTKEVNCIEWHPIHHSILCSGDAAGAIIYWSLLSPDPSKPSSTLEAAHEDAVFSLSFHPLGHLLCSGSKDFTARFWSRARPVGGHENDRWHVGEEKALASKYEQVVPTNGDGEISRGAAKRVRSDEVNDSSLPGLSNFGGLPGLDHGISNRSSQSSYPSGNHALPGFGSRPEMPASNNAGGFTRTLGPLPSQDEMLRQTGGDVRGDRNGGRRQGPPAGYGGLNGGFAGGQGGYGGQQGNDYGQGGYGRR